MFQNAIGFAVIALTSLAACSVAHAQASRTNAAPLSNFSASVGTSAKSVDSSKAVRENGMLVAQGYGDGYQHGPSQGPPPPQGFMHPSRRQYPHQDHYIYVGPPQYEYPYQYHHRHHYYQHNNGGLKYYRYNGELWALNIDTGNRFRVSVGIPYRNTDDGRNYMYQGRRYHINYHTGIRIEID
jgi:hypothetical protein